MPRSLKAEHAEALQPNTMIGVKFECFNDMLAFAGDFVERTGYTNIRPWETEGHCSLVPLELVLDNIDLVEKFDGILVEDYQNLPPRKARSRFTFGDVVEATETLKREHNDWYTNPRYK